jgi:ribonuclease P protein component
LSGRFDRNARIRRRVEFQRVYERGARIQSRYSTLFVLPNPYSNCRLGIAATKKLGGAVLRNRAKRLIREAFRRNRIGAGLDIVVIPRVGMLKAAFADIQADYVSALRRHRGR